jgi:putative FmdB family regulatory protein
MPLYEYRCRACGRSFEFLQKLHEPPVAVCPECGGELVKLLSAPAFQFKGSGWYATDYAKKSGGGSGGGGGEPSKSDAGQSGSSDAAPAAKSESSSESKPAAKADGPGSSSTPSSSGSD